VRGEQKDIDVGVGPRFSPRDRANDHERTHVLSRFDPRLQAFKEVGCPLDV
jgi:hypothetical protein